MRFSLRTLLFLFPAFLICYGISFALAYWLFEPVNAAKDIGSGVHSMLLEGYIFRSSDLPEIDAAKLNLWFNDKLPISDPNYSLYNDFFRAKRDPWGRVFLAVSLSADFDPQSQLEEPVWVAVYSLGKDGISKTHGNDPDDISPWRAYNDSTRLERIAQQRQRVHMKAAIMSPILLVVAILLVQVFVAGTNRA
jgi:hypothetical protein